jgi:hypothetical protein
MKKSFLPKSEDGLRNWLRNLATKIGGYAAKYVITPAEVTGIQTAANDYEAILDYANAVDSYKQKVNTVKAELRDGIPAGATPSILGAAPMPPMLTTDPGIVMGISAIANRIKGSLQYTISDGEDLGLEGAVVTVDYATVKPKISAITAFEDKVVLDWVKAGMQGVIISRSLDGTNWETVDKDFKSPWEDESFNRTSAAEWRYYRLRYLHNDQPVGLVSDVVKVLVSIGSGSPTPPKP